MAASRRQFLWPTAGLYGIFGAGPHHKSQSSDGGRRLRRGVGSRRLKVDVRFHLHDAPRVAVANVAAGLADGLRLPPLEADLHDALATLGGLDHGPALAHIVGQWLLAVDIEIALAGVDERQRVPVRRRPDDHHLQSGQVEQLAVMLEGLRTRSLQLLHFGGCGFQVLAVHVRERHALHTAVLERGVQIHHSIPAAANQPELELGRGLRGDGQASEKLATILHQPYDSGIILAMPNTRIVVLDGYTLNPGDLSWEALRGQGEVKIFDRTPPELIVEHAAGAEILLTNKTPLTASTLAQLPGLRYIGVLATGYNIVDTAAARERGVVVTNVPTYGTASVAQFAFALLLELCHHVGAHSAGAPAEWPRSADWCYWRSPLVELSGKTLGVVGFGRIGRQAARIGDAFGMRILAHDAVPANPPDYPGFAWAAMDEIFREADVVSLHCPLTPETKELVNRRRLGLMKPSAFLINTARGPLVSERDLADALAAGTIAGAALDVLPVEPPVNGSPLLGAPNCVVTPHIAWATAQARARLLATVVENIAAFRRGAPVNAVA